LKKCTLPLTGTGCIDRIVTDLGVIDITKDGFVLREFAPGLSPEAVAKATDAPRRIATDVREMTF
jgi:3-oxoacid CoA-transferase subunit B